MKYNAICAGFAALTKNRTDDSIGVMFGWKPKPQPHPFTQYLRELESEVLTLRNRQRIFFGGSFTVGFAAGAAAVWLLRLIAH